MIIIKSVGSNEHGTLLIGLNETDIDQLRAGNVVCLSAESFPNAPLLVPPGITFSIIVGDDDESMVERVNKSAGSLTMIQEQNNIIQ